MKSCTALLPSDWFNHTGEQRPDWILLYCSDLIGSCSRFVDLEGKLKEDIMMARIRDAENTQCVAELTQKISNLEYKVGYRHC